MTHLTAYIRLTQSPGLLCASSWVSRTSNFVSFIVRSGNCRAKVPFPGVKIFALDGVRDTLFTKNHVKAFLTVLRKVRMCCRFSYVSITVQYSYSKM